MTSATETINDGIKVCAVDGTLAPAISFHVVLPSEGWTQRYLQVGCGGLGGQIIGTGNVFNSVDWIRGAAETVRLRDLPGTLFLQSLAIRRSLGHAALNVAAIATLRYICEQRLCARSSQSISQRPRAVHCPTALGQV